MDKCWLHQYQRGIPDKIHPEEFKNINDYMADVFTDNADKIAFTNMKSELTFAEVDKRSQQLAAYLQTLGLNKGARIAIMMPNLLQYPIAIFAILRAGFAVVNINPLYTANEVSAQLQDSEADAVIVVANFSDTIQAALKDASSVKHVIVTEIGDSFDFIKRNIVNTTIKHYLKMVPKCPGLKFIKFNQALKIGDKAKFTDPKLTLNDIAFIQYTGGTTGISKGAVLTHKNIVANIQQTNAWLTPIKHIKKQIIVTALPLYHIFSLTANLFTFFKLGANNILITNPRDTERFLKEIKNTKFTAITGVNTLFLSMINHPNFNKINFKNLRITLSGGMALEKKVASCWHKVTKTPILEAYGLTETSPAVAINPLSTNIYNGSVGLPLPSTDVSIRDKDGHELPIGEVGELSILGPQVMREYWQKPEETEQSFWSDGYLRTGDTARIDELGYIYLVDRIKDLIIVSGFNVYPHQVEEVILQIPGVKEAAVIAVNKGTGHEAVKACVVTEDSDISADDIINHCRENLTSYKIPRTVEFFSELPKSNIGKILKKDLQ